MTIYNENNVPILFVPDQKVGLSEEGYREYKAARDEGRKALYDASDNVRDASEALQRAQAATSADDQESLARAEAAQEAFNAAREAQIEVEHKYLLAGHSVVIHNKDPRQVDATSVGIGASDLDEALKEAIGGFDLAHVGEDGQSSDVEFKPDWVASTHPLLGKLLADYYDCDQRNIAEVL